MLFFLQKIKEIKMAREGKKNEFSSSLVDPGKKGGGWSQLYLSSS